MGKGFNILGQNSRVGEVAGGALENLLNSGETGAFPQLAAGYSEKQLGAVDGPGGTAYTVETTPSLFNPFYGFRYSKHGSKDGSKYSPENHIDSGGVSLNILGGQPSVKNPLKIFNADKDIIENPTAGEIINRSQRASEEKSVLASMPYQWNDFLWCKWYGKIPNNRLLTLRRYPIPVEDDLRVADSKAPLVPIAQAVTWWGSETGNTLSNVLGITYGFPWTPLQVNDLQEITGNEVKAEALLDAAGVTGDNARKVLLATLFDNPDNPQAVTGFDATLQQWTKDAYGSSGQYWNRVRGPVNVINSTLIRGRGYTFTHTIKLEFVYKLRSFNNFNPKVAMLDLITNFLSLTYNKAEFWGGGIQYFQQTGYILPGLNTTKFEKGDFVGGIDDVIKYARAQVDQKLAGLKEVMAKIGKDFKDDKSLGGVVKKLEESRAVQNLTGSWVKEMMQKPLTMRSFLDGRAVGEWHLTVGNPMNPIAVIGNLCLESTQITLSDSLGLDDFPTEVKFTVSLKPGRPRAKQDIESMFNLGKGSMGFTQLSDPSSANNTLGEINSTLANNVKFGRNDTQPNAKDALNRGIKSAAAVSNIVNSFPNRADQPNSANVPSAEATANAYRKTVESFYGSRFGQSPAMIDYFRDLKLKD